MRSSCPIRTFYLNLLSLYPMKKARPEILVDKALIIIRDAENSGTLPECPGASAYRETVGAAFIGSESLRMRKRRKKGGKLASKRGSSGASIAGLGLRGARRALSSWGATF